MVASECWTTRRKREMVLRADRGGTASLLSVGVEVNQRALT
jgi:hypothetical protein